MYRIQVASLRRISQVSTYIIKYTILIGLGDIENEPVSISLVNVEVRLPHITVNKNTFKLERMHWIRSKK